MRDVKDLKSTDKNVYKMFVGGMPTALNMYVQLSALVLAVIVAIIIIYYILYKRVDDASSEFSGPMIIVRLNNERITAVPRADVIAEMDKLLRFGETRLTSHRVAAQYNALIVKCIRDIKNFAKLNNIKLSECTKCAIDNNDEEAYRGSDSDATPFETLNHYVKELRDQIDSPRYFSGMLDMSNLIHLTNGINSDMANVAAAPSLVSTHRGGDISKRDVRRLVIASSPFD